MSEHTPGPWVYQYFPEEDTWCIGYPGVDGMIAMAVPNEHLPTAVSAEANARLIAAAPDLLEACELIADWCDEYGEEHGVCLFCGPRHADNCPLNTINAATAKAKGEQP